MACYRYMSEKDIMRLNEHSVITAMSKFAPASMSMCTSASSPAEQAYISGVMPYTPTQKERRLNIKKHEVKHAAVPIRSSGFTWSSIVFTPSGPRSWIAWPIRSVRPELSMRKPRSRLNLSAAAFESRRLKEVKQHSGLRKRKRERE